MLIFTRGQLSLHHHSGLGSSLSYPTPNRIRQLSVTTHPPNSWEVSSLFCPTPSRQRWIFPLFMATTFVQGGAICIPAALVPLRGGDVLCSPGGVADSLQWNRVSFRRGSSRLEFKVCVCIIWWVQDVTNSCSVSSAVLCVESAFFQTRERKT
jgi:hypothetical protein